MINIKQKIIKNRFILPLVLIAIASAPFLYNYVKDNTRYYLIPLERRVSISHLGEVSLTINNGNLAYYKTYISACNRIPENYEEIFKPILSDDYQCQALFKEWEPREINGIRENYVPWIDPWGRPYQIRYDRDKKIQIRSQGRYLWTSLDDIEAENYFDGNDYRDQVKKCDELPEDSSDCIFNRGWH